MAKSLRSKREKRLRAIRREIVEPFYEQKEAAKLAAQEAALAAPKLPVRSNDGNNKMEIVSSDVVPTSDTGMDIEMEDEANKKPGSLKPLGKKMKKKLKIAKRKRRGKAGKLRNKHV